MKHLDVADKSVITGLRLVEGVAVMVDGRPLPHMAHHSPSGFEWGYDGSGPADLALSILEVALYSPGSRRVPIWSGSIDKRAWELHQEFKREYVAKWDGGQGWSITVGEVRKWAEA